MLNLLARDPFPGVWWPEIRVFLFFMKYTITINQYAAIKNGLNLDLIDLAIFDFIKDFAHNSNCVKMQTPEGVYFWISHKLVMQEMPLLNIKTNQGLIKRINNLINAGILKKHPHCERYGKTLYYFGDKCDLLSFSNEYTQPSTEIDNPQQKFRDTLNESLGITLNESLGNNNINSNNTINDNSVVPQKDFAENTQEPKDKKTLFRNSEVYNMVKFDENGNGIDYSEFEKKINIPDIERIDSCYYFHRVSDWSDKSNTKRTKRGWLATVRDFIRGDIEKNKLHLKPEYQQKESGMIDYESAMRYLKDEY